MRRRVGGQLVGVVPVNPVSNRLSKRRAIVAPMANNRPPTAHSLLTAAYSGFPNATASIPMTKLVPRIRRSLYDLKRDGVSEHRIGGSYMEIAQADGDGELLLGVSRLFVSRVGHRRPC